MSDAPSDSLARPWSFDELVQTAVALIPAYAPLWTNHNVSDPGITLLELLAYFSEILVYRALRITPDAKLHFLRLLEGRVTAASDPLLGAPSESIDAAVRTLVEELSHVQCAVTRNDFERLAVEAAARHQSGLRSLHAMCVPGVNLRGVINSRHPSESDAPADVSIVLAVGRNIQAEVVDDLCRYVEEALSPRCLLTTRAYVVRAPYLRVFVSCRLAPKLGVPLSSAIEAVDVMLRRRFELMDANEMGSDASRFGRPLHLATIAAMIDRTQEVDYVEDVVVRRIMIDDSTDDAESLVGVRIGVVSRVGLDTRLGGQVSVAMRRFQTDHTGEAQTVLVRPWEVVQVALARDVVQSLDAGGPGAGATGRGRG